jgi:hypothetical protein
VRIGLHTGSAEFAPLSPKEDWKMSKVNKLLVRHIYEAIGKHKDLTVFTTHFTSDYLIHAITEIHGPDGIKH